MHASLNLVIQFTDVSMQRLIINFYFADLINKLAIGLMKILVVYF
jgi:hypothetical protein